LPGVRFVPIRFTPTARQYAGQACGGVQVIVTDWDRIEPLDLGIGIAVVLRARYRERWEPQGMLKLLADQDAYDAILAGKDLHGVRAVWQKELAEFRTVRAKYLIYP
jgi:uncharacterized protein YbbC (DUF1343 family)